MDRDRNVLVRGSSPMLRQLLPPSIDNRYHGRAPALWILGVLLLLRAVMSLNSIFNGEAVARGADGIPLDRFTPEAAQTTVALFALAAFSRLVTTLMGAVALVRYRAMVPLMFVLLLLDHLGRMAVLAALPIPRAGTPPASTLSLAILTLTIVGLGLSLRLRPRGADAPSHG